MNLTQNNSRKIHLAALAWVIGLALSLLAFREAIDGLLTAWGTEEYSHGYFIPVIASLIGWHILVEKPSAVRPSWWGLAFLVVAGGLELVSRLSAFDMAEQYGLIFAIIGLSLSCFGATVAKKLIPAFVYLIFAVPLPHLVQANLSQGLQLFSSTLGVWLLDLFGIPVFQDGNVIDLGGYRLQVAEACNGLRYLFPLMSFGFLVALLLDDAWWKRIVIFLSTIPIGIGLNAARIAFIGITVDAWGQKMAEGFIHSFEGWAVFILCLILLTAEAWCLLRIGKQGRFRSDYLHLPRGPLFTDYVGSKAPVVAAVLSAFILASVYGMGEVHPFAETIPTHPAFASFPTQLGEWQGHPERLDTEILNSLQLSDYWIADYTRATPPASVNFYMAYYGSQRIGTTTHSPANCIPGGGWQVKQSEVVSFPLSDGSKLSVTRMLIQKDRSASLVYYWFDERGRDLTETTYAKWYLLQDSITMHRTDGALVRVLTSLTSANDQAAGDETLRQFIDQAYPAIKSFIPGANIAKTTDVP